MKEVTKTEKHPGAGMTVYDEETEKFVDVSPETQRLAAYVHQQGLMGAFISAVSLKKMWDEKGEEELKKVIEDFKNNFRTL